MLGLKRGTVKVVEYDPEWPGMFEVEKQVLLEKFDDLILAVEHIGSTAVPGLAAKPIIDINVGVRSLDEVEVFVGGLLELGYQVMPERWFEDRWFFPKGPEERRTHHLNLVEVSSETGWVNQLLFRNYLRENNKVRDEYARLKQGLAEKYGDKRGEYTKRKSEFIAGVIEEARGCGYSGSNS